MLVKFFINTTNKGYLNGLATEFNESTNSIRKELNNLSAAGYLLKTKLNNRVIYKANKKHPLFSILQKIVRQHLGIDEIITTILEKLGDVKSVAITGDYAQGIDSGTIHVVLLGDKIDISYLRDLIKKIEKKITRKVSFEIVSEIPSDSLEIYSENLNILNQ
jgi:hypothetical protein